MDLFLRFSDWHIFPLVEQSDIDTFFLWSSQMIMTHFSFDRAEWYWHIFPLIEPSDIDTFFLWSSRVILTHFSFGRAEWYWHIFPLVKPSDIVYISGLTLVLVTLKHIMMLPIKTGSLHIHVHCHYYHSLSNRALCVTSYNISITFITAVNL